VEGPQVAGFGSVNGSKASEPGSDMARVVKWAQG